MDYPAAVLDKAQRLEQLLLRVAAGEPLGAVNAALGLSLDQDQLAHWQAKYEAGGQKWEALIDGRHGCTPAESKMSMCAPHNWSLRSKRSSVWDSVPGTSTTCCGNAV
jgi:hypothetical protein